MALIAHWKLNDNAADTVVADASGSGNNATSVQNTSVVHITGQIDGAIDFNGTTDKATCATDSIGTGPISVACWFRASGYGALGVGRIIDNGKYFLFFDSATKMTLTSNAGGNTHKTGNLSLDTTYHFVATRDAAGASYLYLNGDVVGGVGASGTPAAGTTALVIGNRAGNDRGFDGWIDDLRIYNEVLTAGQVKAIWASGRGTEVGLPWAAARLRRSLRSAA